MFEVLGTLIFRAWFYIVLLACVGVSGYYAYVKLAYTPREIWVRTVARLVFWMLVAFFLLLSVVITYFMVVLSLHYG